MSTVTFKAIYLVLTICYGSADCQVWVPEVWKGTDPVKLMAHCESFAMAAYGQEGEGEESYSWYCAEEGEPAEFSN